MCVLELKFLRRPERVNREGAIGEIGIIVIMLCGHAEGPASAQWRTRCECRGLWKFNYGKNFFKVRL